MGVWKKGGWFFWGGGGGGEIAGGILDVLVLSFGHP